MGIEALSHLSILPTVLRDVDCLCDSLRALGLSPERDGMIQGFAAESHPVLVAIQLEDGISMGWSRRPDGCLALVGDLQRLSRRRDLQPFLGQLTRTYAACAALRDGVHHNARLEFGA